MAVSRQAVVDLTGVADLPAVLYLIALDLIAVLDPTAVHVSCRRPNPVDPYDQVTRKSASRYHIQCLGHYQQFLP
jgi:hypothetical protein